EVLLQQKEKVIEEDSLVRHNTKGYWKPTQKPKFYGIILDMVKGEVKVLEDKPKNKEIIKNPINDL
ncbi:7284_t:CDS:1, partial [Racocetra fulgida]